MTGISKEGQTHNYIISLYDSGNKKKKTYTLQCVTFYCEQPDATSVFKERYVTKQKLFLSLKSSFVFLEDRCVKHTPISHISHKEHTTNLVLKKKSVA